MGLVVLFLGAVDFSVSKVFFTRTRLDLVEFEGFEAELSFLDWVFFTTLGVILVEFKIFEVELSFFSLLRIVGSAALVEFVVGLMSLV